MSGYSPVVVFDTSYVCRYGDDVCDLPAGLEYKIPGGVCEELTRHNGAGGVGKRGINGKNISVQRTRRYVHDQLGAQKVGAVDPKRLRSICPSSARLGLVDEEVLACAMKYAETPGRSAVILTCDSGMRSIANQLFQSGIDVFSYGGVPDGLLEGIDGFMAELDDPTSTSSYDPRDECDRNVLTPEIA